MEDDFYVENLSCCSLELHWRDKNNEENSNNSYEYELYAKGQNKELIYKGKHNNFLVEDLKPNKSYKFRLKIFKSGEFIEKRKIDATTLNSPIAILSQKSIDIANGSYIYYSNTINDFQIKIINNCSKLIFNEKDENIIKGDFEGIEIKITHENETNITYISFDINPDYYEIFFNRYILEYKNDIKISCYFVIQKLPTLLILNLLEKGSIILTGTRFGGVIASSLTFYLLYLKKLFKKEIYGNAFLKNEKNCIGVVTFGSPSFLIDYNTALNTKELTPYFYNIKEEFDYFPAIMDFINKDPNSIKLKYIVEKNEPKDIEILNKYIKNNIMIKGEPKINFDSIIRIPFGYYFMMNGTNSLLTQINENTFEDFYYLKSINSNNPMSNYTIYKKLSSKMIFNKEILKYLENKNNNLKYIKIIRRNNKLNSMKGIIKFKIINSDNNIIPPDIIKQIILISNKNKYKIEHNDIYYDNDIDITSYVDNLNEKINEVIIINNFGGEMKTDYIINIQGSGPTSKMLKHNIEKLFLFPFFKLFELFYTSLEDKEKYKKLKQENFGENFEELKILKSFEMQIKSIDQILFFSRPDILGQSENKFIKEYIKKMTPIQEKIFNEKMGMFYKQALKIQKIQKIKCLDSELESIAKSNSFPEKINGKTIKKLFMCERQYFEHVDYINIITSKFDDEYIKNCFVESLIKETLQKIENEIIKDLDNKNADDTKKLLNEKIGKFYNDEIIPNVYFILLLILSSIEGGDEIIFNHKIDWEKINIVKYFFCFALPEYTPFISISKFYRRRSKYEKDFKKNYSKNEIEEINMKNLFYKIKTKKIVNSNINSQEQNDFNFKSNKIYDFSVFSENQIVSGEYYKKFLEILNNYSNDFQEDIEISVYDNLKEENKNREHNYFTIKEIMREFIIDEESKKGFLSLVRQSFFLGKLRNEIVRFFIFNL